jgi:outer membrane protein OmpA-like peptidoglycan-associated protein
MTTIAFHLGKATKLGSAGRVGRARAWVTAVIAVLAGCGLITACQPAADPPARIFVVVASATANEPAPVLAAPDRTMLRTAGSTSADAAAYVMNPDTGQAQQVSLTPRRSDGEVDYGPDRDAELAHGVTRVQHLLNGLAATVPFDLLGLIGQAIRVTSRPGTLLILSSGLSTAGAFDLRQVGWGASPRAAAASLAHGGQLPRLAGWRVVFSGLGDTAGRQPALPLPQRTVLSRYWLALCQQAGAVSCTVDGVTRPEPPARSTMPVPVVPVPRVTSYRGPHGQTTTVPADALFAFNSARLLPGTDAIIRPVAVQARTRDQHVTIVGYASPDGGTSAYNLTLSAERAQAVRSRLHALGVPAGLLGPAIGLGTDHHTRAACWRGGHLDESRCAKLRRVVITLHG